MKLHDKLDSFVFVHGGAIISPALTTTREYGAWFSSVFDNYTSSQALYIAKNVDGGKVMTSHPGTRIGGYFDKHNFAKPELKCWYVDKESDIMKQIIWHNLADVNDCSMYGSKMMLRVYTVEQIELYIQSTIDKKFRIGDMMLPSKKIQVNNLGLLIRPELKKKKTLF